MVSGINCRGLEKDDRVPPTHGAISPAQIKYSVNKILRYHGDVGQQIQILGQQWVWVKVETSTTTWHGKLRQMEAHLLCYVAQGVGRCDSVITSDSRLQTALFPQPQFSWYLDCSHSALSHPPMVKRKSEKLKKWPLHQAPSYEILPNPCDARWPSHSYLKISFENNLSNKWKTYRLTDLSCDLTFWIQPQQKQKAEAQACGGSASVCVSIWEGSIDFGSAALASPKLNGLLS